LPPSSEPGAAVVVEDLWVRFNTTRERDRNLKRSVMRRMKTKKSPRAVDALKGVSFEVEPGGVFGVIGPNGAGKSTLFRTLAGVYPPTEGRIELYGKVTPLLSLGIGFNRELTGRENVLLGGLAFGMQRDEIFEHYEEVIEFADLGEAIDSPMRTFSSGMFGRLAFSVAAHLNPEIILIDEALAAGDASFRDKSFNKIIELCEQQCTVLIVSHGLQVIKQLATRAIWLEKGEVAMSGDSDEVVQAYLASRGMNEKLTAMEDF
jgi:teichoic acid transport system ATP-binding protein